MWWYCSKVFGQPSCWSCCEARREMGIFGTWRTWLGLLKNKDSAVNPKHILHITINMLLSENWLMIVIYALNHWDCTTFKWWYESICRDGKWCFTLLNWPTNHFGIYLGMAPKIITADFQCTECIQPHAKPQSVPYLNRVALTVQYMLKNAVKLTVNKAMQMPFACQQHRRLASGIINISWSFVQNLTNLLHTNLNQCRKILFFLSLLEGRWKNAAGTAANIMTDGVWRLSRPTDGRQVPYTGSTLMWQVGS